MKSGIYALASLEGEALDPGELAVLGLDRPGARRRERAGIAAQAIDREEAGRAVSIADRAGGFTMLLGHFDEADALADRLGLARGTSGAALGAAGLARYGADAASRMIGEWTLLDWDGESRTLTLQMSEASRDPLYFAFGGGKVAASAEMNRLTRLAWVGRDYDPGGMLLHWGTARLRHHMTEETMFRRVRRLAPGSREVFRAGGRTTMRLAPLDPAEPWRGTHGEAMEAIEAVLRRIMGQHLARHQRVGSLLSGGLDSSVTAWLAAAERGPDQPLTFFCSVAPDGSGVPDEREHARAVANRLNLPIRFVAPPPEASLYVPDARMLAHHELPVASPRHYLYDLLYRTASDEGVDLLVDGAYGELTISNGFPLLLPLWSPRRHVRAWRDWRRSRSKPAPPSPFHVRLAPALFADFEGLAPFDWRAPFDPMPKKHPREMWGRRAAAVKNAMTPTTSPEAKLRHIMPFRDRRLLDLVAGMPAAYMEHQGLNRAPARLLLKDRLPDSVRLRRTGAPFSPDFLVRAERQALPTIERLHAFRAAGAAEWVDLDWVEAQLRRLATPGTATYERVHRVQATLAAAAYLTWQAGAPAGP